jgi:cysteinyl-tRNA synthetase
MTAPSANPRRPWRAIHNWTYWLDGPKLARIHDSAFELAVIDPSADGTTRRSFTPAQLAELREGGCARRVVAYLNIGQAESYRSYWRREWRVGAPNWLAVADPDWPGDFFVRYWAPEWQAIVEAALDRIVDAGFDGVYLDRIDSCFESYAAGHERAMVEFVLALAVRARARAPLGDDFGVIAQNAEELLPRHADYAACLTGLAREETYVRATDEPTGPAERAATERLLDLARQTTRAGLVLTVDYADRPELVRLCYERASELGYVPYVTDVDLNRLRVNVGYEPVCVDWELPTL